MWCVLHLHFHQGSIFAFSKRAYFPQVTLVAHCFYCNRTTDVIIFIDVVIVYDSTNDIHDLPTRPRTFLFLWIHKQNTFTEVDSRRQQHGIYRLREYRFLNDRREFQGRIAAYEGQFGAGFFRGTDCRWLFGPCWLPLVKSAQERALDLCFSQ